MKIPRFTMRGLLCLITLTGIAFGLFVWVQRRAEFSSRSSYHAGQYRMRLALLAGSTRGVHRGRGVTSPEPVELALVRHHFTLARKYERAARYPWLPVEPDPPEPK